MVKCAALFLLLLSVAFFDTARADEMPAHLGGILSSLARQSMHDLSRVNADESAIRHAKEESLKALKTINASVYARTPINTNSAVTQLQNDLGLAAGNNESATFIQEIWHMPDADVRQKINALGQSLDAEKILQSLDIARSGGGLKTFYTLPLDDGKSITIDWQPDTGKTTLDVASDGSVFDEYIVTMQGTMPLKYDEAQQTFALVPEASGASPEVATEKDLDARRQSILGEWSVEGVGMLVIRASDAKAGDVARSKKEIQSESDHKRREIERIKADKYHLWRNSQTRAEERQEKFRRLDAPWEYLGDIPKDASQVEKIAMLEREIANLDQELKAGEPPAVAQDPIGFERVKTYPKTRALSLELVMKEDCRFRMDEAYFDGRTLAARTTQKKTCSMGEHLPQPVRNNLATGGWNPPLWLIARVDETQGNTILALFVSQYGMRVKYNPESYEVSGILQPHMDKSAMGRRSNDENQKYTIPEGALP